MIDTYRSFLFWKCNSPMNPHVLLLVGPSVCVLSLGLSYRSTFFLQYSPALYFVCWFSQMNWWTPVESIAFYRNNQRAFPLVRSDGVVFGCVFVCVCGEGGGGDVVEASWGQMMNLILNFVSVSAAAVSGVARCISSARLQNNINYLLDDTRDIQVIIIMRGTIRVLRLDHMEVEFLSLVRNYDRPPNQPTDNRVNREFTPLITRPKEL